MALDISSFLDLKKLQRILDLFSDATGLATVAVNMSGDSLTKASNFTDFCMKYTRGSAEGLKRCVQCDVSGKGTYFCHAGLMDFACPIMVNGEQIGNILGGQVLPKAPNFEAFRPIARELGIDETVYLEALSKVPIRPEKTIRAAADLLDVMINQWVNSSYLEMINKKTVEVFSVESVCMRASIDAIKSHTRELVKTARIENILSINASIEAGRAGKEGVGFSVIANEIGRLAKSSSSAYEDVQTLVLALETSHKKIIDVNL